MTDITTAELILVCCFLTVAGAVCIGAMYASWWIERNAGPVVTGVE